MRYVIDGTKLTLDGFWVNVKGDDPPKINGKSPRKENELRGLGFNYEYTDLNLKIPFNGSIWAGSDFIDSRYVHMGFQDASAYKVVIKFDFENGDIVNVEDRSKQAEYERGKKPSKSRPKSGSARDIEEWIDRRFSLDPDYRND